MAGATFFLIIAGALVTSNDAGLATEDWPLSNGQFFPAMVGNLFWEHGHRMLLVSVAGPDRFRCGRIDGGVTLPVRTIRRNRVEEMRDLVSWLAPSANHMFVNVYLLNSKW